MAKNNVDFLPSKLILAFAIVSPYQKGPWAPFLKGERREKDQKPPHVWLASFRAGNAVTGPETPEGVFPGAFPQGAPRLHGQWLRFVARVFDITWSPERGGPS